MFKNIRTLTLLVLSLTLTSGCLLKGRSLQEFLQNPFVGSSSVSVPIPQIANTVIMCRAKQCSPVDLSMSQEYVYTSLVQLLENNNHEKALLCSADDGSKNCYQHFVSLPITVGITPAYLYIDSAKISDVQIDKRNRALDLMLSYNVSYNGQEATCSTADSTLFVKNTESVTIKDNGYKCKMTTIGTSSVKSLFLVNYIDLDYGIIGGYMTIGVSGPAYGGGSSYVLLRLKENGLYPSKPDLKKLEEKVKKSQSKASKYLSDINIHQGSDSTDTEGVKVFPIEAKKSAD